MSREIWHSVNPDESDWALDDNQAEGIALGMTGQEAEAWSHFADFVYTVDAMGVRGTEVPTRIAESVAVIRAWFLAQPQERRLVELTDVEPVKTTVR